MGAVLRGGATYGRVATDHQEQQQVEDELVIDIGRYQREPDAVDAVATPQEQQSHAGKNNIVYSFFLRFC